jgi:OPT family oligopeptide transporter
MFIPIAIIMAIANQHFSLYLVAQLICGYVFPGRPVANMVFTVYCYISSSQAVKFSSDLKLGHYMKIPPKTMFMVQMVATLISSLAQVGVLNWMFANIPSLCSTDAINGFSCPLARVHFNGSILWGVVGPHRFFGKDALYGNLIWAFVIGFFAPIILWISWKKTNIKFLRKINLPLLLGSLSWIPPAVSRIPQEISEINIAIEWSKLFRLGCGLFHFQSTDSSTCTPMVEQIHDDAFCSFRLWSSIRPSCDILWLCVPRCN